MHIVHIICLQLLRSIENVLMTIQPAMSSSLTSYQTTVVYRLSVCPRVHVQTTATGTPVAGPGGLEVFIETPFGCDQQAKPLKSADSPEIYFLFMYILV